MLGIMDHTRLIFTYQERIYRLALCVSGGARAAARRTERAFARLRRGGADPESALVAALGRPAPLLPRPYALPAAPAGADAAQLAALRGLLAAAPPALRHALGLRYLLGAEWQSGGAEERERGRGASPSMDAAPYGRARVSAPDARPAPTTLSAFLTLLARAQGRLPADVSHAEAQGQARLRLGLLDEQEAQALRAVALSDSPDGARARAIRDGIVAADAWLHALLPALFAVPVPPTLTRRLLRRAAPRRPLLRWSRPLALQLGAVALVGALIAGLLLWPGGAPERASAPGPIALADAPGLKPHELIARALDRFETDGMREGVLHERYTVTIEQEPWTIERWYDRGAPQRLRIEVRTAEGELRYGLATDGVGLVQQRFATPAGGGSDRYEILGADHRLDPARIARLMPLMRGQPDGLLIFGQGDRYSADRYYLALAYAATLRDLGAATVAGRPAQLVGLTGDRPFPPPLDLDPGGWPQQPSQLVLAIDTERYALLEARVIPASDGAPSVVQLPWQAEVFEVLPGAGPEIFALPPPDRAQPFTPILVSPRLREAPADALPPLPEILQGGATLYLPPPTEQPSIGYAVPMAPEQPLLIREAEHSVVLVVPFTDGQDIFPANTERRRRQAGGFSYDLLSRPEFLALLPATVASVYLTPDERAGIMIVYTHSYATDAERESLMDDLIRSLRPLTPETIPEIAGDFTGG